MTALTMVLPRDEPYSPATGGAVATVGDGLVRALAAVGIDVHVVAPPTRGGAYAGTLTQVRGVRTLPGRVLARAARASRHPLAGDDARYREAVAARIADDAVVVHNDPRLAARLARDGHRAALWLHNLLPDGEGVRDAVAAGVGLVAVSEFVRRWTAATHAVPAAAIGVAHNTIDADTFRPPHHWAPTGRLRVVIHGRIDPGKGQVLAARAVARARAAGAPVDLAVVGRVRTFGIASDVVAAYVRDLRAALAAADATWLGPTPRDAVPGLLRAFDASLALPTAPEPFSLAALEAMACGCAVVAVPRGGLAEVVGDAALLCEPEPRDIADALAELAGDPRALAQWRERARERAGTFAWPGRGAAAALAAIG